MAPILQFPDELLLRIVSLAFFKSNPETSRCVCEDKRESGSIRLRLVCHRITEITTPLFYRFISIKSLNSKPAARKLTQIHALLRDNISLREHCRGPALSLVTDHVPIDIRVADDLLGWLERLKCLHLARPSSTPAPPLPMNMLSRISQVEHLKIYGLDHDIFSLPAYLRDEGFGRLKILTLDHWGDQYIDIKTLQVCQLNALQKKTTATIILSTNSSS